AHHIMSKTDPKVGARQRLSGLVKDVLNADSGPEQLRMSTRMERLRVLTDRFEQTLGDAASITARQFEVYLTNARLSGVGDTTLARRHLISHFTELRWTVEAPSAET